MKKIFGAFIMTSAILVGGTFAATNASAAEHKVSNHETLWEIAQNYDSSVQDLKEINNLDSDIIHPGQILETETEVMYTVQKGDTLSKIAVDHQMTVKKLKAMNDLSSSLIIVGDKLKVQNNATEENTEQHVEEAPEQTKAEEPAKTEAPAKVETPNTEEPANTEAVDNSGATDNSKSEASGKSFAVTATAYTASCNGCSGTTATGIDLKANPNQKVIAVDPSVIPLGTKVHVDGYGEAIAADTGGAIQGNKIDVFVPSKSEAMGWGVQTVNVTILD